MTWEIVIISARGYRAAKRYKIVLVSRTLDTFSVVFPLRFIEFKTPIRGTACLQIVLTCMSSSGMTESPSSVNNLLFVFFHTMTLSRLQKFKVEPPFPVAIAWCKIVLHLHTHCVHNLYLSSTYVQLYWYIRVRKVKTFLISWTCFWG
jgi:hypothetical protein